MSQYGWRCTAVTQHLNPTPPGIELIRYAPAGGATAASQYLTRTFENAVATAKGVYDALKPRRDLKPDLIVAHSGFGSSLFLPFLFDAPLINFFEYFYHPVGQDLGYRPEVEVTEIGLLRAKIRNTTMLLDLDNCDQGWTPTHYQRALFPPEFHSKIEVLFDGIPTDRFHRRVVPDRLIAEAGPIPPDHRIVTYVTRGYELMRGFDIFMKAAKRIYQQYPNVIFIVAGGDRVHYGPDKQLITRDTFREHVLASDDYDLSKFRFIRNNSPELLSIGDAHIYLTVPFITSWSMVEAMACGAVVVASDQPGVREYITDGENGLLCDFFDVEGMAARVVEVLRDPERFRPIGDAAVRTVAERYSLEVTLPKINDFFETVAKRPPMRPRLPRIETLVQPGTWARVRNDEPGSDLEPGEGPPDEATDAAPPSMTSTNHLDVSGMLRQFAAQNKSVEEWVRIAQAFRGNLDLPRLGPDQHPIDLTRLLTRIKEWKAEHLLILGESLGGILFLLTRVAIDAATIVVTGTPESPIPSERFPSFEAMARAAQKIIVVPTATDREDLARQVQSSAGSRKFDVAIMNGFRPFTELRADFRHYRNRVRRGGLLAWTAVRPIVPPDPNHDGGDRLWKEVKPMYPQNAEYLSGTTGVYGGIVMVKIS
jgi:glycosyltransferase involved in cell wall biosynthesis